MELFELINGRAFPSAHVLLIEPFKTIWEKDTTAEKANAIKVFSYVELVCSPKKSNPFIGYSEDKRPGKVKAEIFGREDYPTTEFMTLATIKYKELLADSSPTYSLFTSALNAKDKLIEFLDNFDLGERTQGGTAVLKPADITKALKEIPDVAKSIITMRDKVTTEIIEDTKTRNQREVGQYER